MDIITENYERIVSVVKHAMEISKKYGKLDRAAVAQICQDEEINLFHIKTKTQGCYVITPDNEKYIFLREGLNDEDYLETAAHELGHYFLHTEKMIEHNLSSCLPFAKRGDLDLIEYEANAFGFVLTHFDIIMQE